MLLLFRIVINKRGQFFFSAVVQISTIQIASLVMDKMPASQATTTFTTIVGMTLTLVLVGLLAVVAMLGSRWEKQLRQEVRIQVYFQRDLDQTILKTAQESVETDEAIEDVVI